MTIPKNSLPVAHCVELNKIMTREEALRLRAQNPEQKLTFTCAECNLPLTFHARFSGVMAQGFFMRRTGQNHLSCLSSLRTKDTSSKQMQSFQDFESSLLKSEDIFKKLRQELLVSQNLLEQLLTQLSVLNTGQQKERLEMEQGFGELPQGYEFFEGFFKEIEELYVPFRQRIQGY